MSDPLDFRIKKQRKFIHNVEDNNSHGAKSIENLEDNKEGASESIPQPERRQCKFGHQIYGFLSCIWTCLAQFQHHTSRQFALVHGLKDAGQFLHLGCLEMGLD